MGIEPIRLELPHRPGLVRVSARDVVLLIGRVRQVYPDQGILTVRTITPGSAGGPGYRQDVVSMLAVAGTLPEPLDVRLVPFIA